MLVTLSYPEFDSRGERNLPSIYLEDLLQPPVDSLPVRPAPRSLPEPRSAPRIAAQIAAGDLLDFLRRKQSGELALTDEDVPTEQEPDQAGGEKA